jgi:O-antigen/teichoic acid export membrane protein
MGREAATLASAGVITRLLGLVAQVAIGLLLLPGELGLYGFAVAIALFLQSIRDGGARLYLLSGGLASYRSRASNAFWTAVTFSLATAAVLILAGPLVADYANFTQSRQVFNLLAASMLPTPFVVLSSVQLQLHYRFRELAVGEVASTGVRVLAVVGGAMAGLGASSLALGMLAGALTEAAYLSSRARPFPLLRHGTDRKAIGMTLKGSGWAMAGGVANAVPKQGDFVIVGFVQSASVLGSYYFAYQLVNQVVQLCGWPFGRVFASLVANKSIKRSGDQTKQLYQATRSLMLVGSLLLGLVAVTYEPLQAAVWGDRWIDTVGAVQILSALLALHLMAFPVEYMIQGRGLFRYWFVSNLIRGLFLPTTLLIAATIMGDLTVLSVSLVVGGYRALAGVVYVCASAHRGAYSAVTYLRQGLGPILCGTLAGFPCLMAGVLMPGPHVWRAAASGGLFALTYVLLSWLFMASSLKLVTMQLLRPSGQSS